jgi:hypothetical protein
LAKARYPKEFCIVSTAPTTTTSLVPASSSRAPRCTAAREEAQAASTVQFIPPRSKRLATRPAVTLTRIPGKESSVHGGRSCIGPAAASPSRPGRAARTAYF